MLKTHSKAVKILVLIAVTSILLVSNGCKPQHSDITPTETQSDITQSPSASDTEIPSESRSEDSSNVQSETSPESNGSSGSETVSSSIFPSVSSSTEPTPTKKPSPTATTIPEPTSTVTPYQLPSIGTANVQFDFNLNNQGQVINNKFGYVNSWYYDGWIHRSNLYKENYFKDKYPFFDTVHVMTATGGSEQRDLFINPNDRTVLDDYKFDNLINAIENMIYYGLTPYIKLGNVPLKYSSNPKIGKDFGVNVRPPDDYNVYYNYIRALVEEMVKKFGIAKVRTFSWAAIVEFENRDWFEATNIFGSASPTATRDAYFKLYDYTVAALEDVLGAQYVNVGAHSMTIAKGYWDEKEFINHCVNGTNYKTGKKGTRIDFLAISFYDRQFEGFNSVKFLEAMSEVRDEAVRLGLTNLKYGMDEGQILNGFDNKPLISRVINMSCQGSANAKIFQTLVENDIDWFAAWGLTTNGLWGGLDSITSHISNLTYKMAGGTHIKASNIKKVSQTESEVDGLASFNQSNNTLRVLVYNNSDDYQKKMNETISIKIDNIKGLKGDEVIVHKWAVDDNNANWWPLWEKDEAKLNLTDADYGWSRYSVEIPSVLLSSANRNIFLGKLIPYRQANSLEPVEFKARISGNTLIFKDNLPGHGVALYEIFDVVKK